MEPEKIKQMIHAALPDCEVLINGDGRHFDAIIVSEAFKGKSMIEQHRMVYATLGNKMQSEEVHALSMKTYTPEQWAKIKSS